MATRGVRRYACTVRHHVGEDEAGPVWLVLIDCGDVDMGIPEYWKSSVCIRELTGYIDRLYHSLDVISSFSADIFYND